MELRKYSEFFRIDEDYSPEINPDSIKSHKEEWKNTYPHKDFIAFLKAYITMINRASNKAKHDILLHGAYGTGKSRFLWTLTQLMNCSDDDFNYYWDKYGDLKKETDLRAKFEAVRSEKILVIFEYSTGEISTIREFIVHVYDCITRELKTKGLETVAAKTIRGSIANKLEDNMFRPAFEGALKNDEFRSMGSIGGKTIDDIIDQLRDPSRSCDSLIIDLNRIAERIGFTMFNPTIDFLKEWITEVIQVNSLANIVFVWDEFSSFFRKLKNELDSVQKLQELHDSQPFNFIVAAHLDAEQTRSSALFDRYTQMEVTMPDSVAFELIRDSMKIEDMYQSDYNELTSELADNTFDVRKKVCDGAKIVPDVMRGILPIHPMAALLLKHISVEFASNQRSMFNFIKTNEGDTTRAFQWYIKNHSPENGDLLTIDYLWDFFYVTGTDEHSSSTGKANLSRQIVSILDTYTLNEDKLDDDDQRRVLKTILMMQAISRKTNNSIDLLRPTKENLNWAFKGDEDLDNYKADSIALNQLVKAKKILYIDVNGKVTEYASASGNVDNDKLDEIKEQLKADTKTAKLVETAGLIEAFNFSAALQMRYDFSVSATADELNFAVNRILNSDKDYKFRTVICFARNEDEQQRLRKKLEEYAEDDKYKDIIFIDVSSIHLGIDAFEQWLDAAARAQYNRKTDPNLADNKEKEAKKALQPWKDRVSEGAFTLRIGSSHPIGCPSMPMLYKELEAHVLRVYPYSIDNAQLTSGCYRLQQPNASAKYAIEVKPGGTFNDKVVDNLLGEVRNVEKYWEKMPDKSISKLKIMVDDLIKKALDTNRRISMQEIIDLLSKQGLIPADCYAYLAGFLLKEYADNKYRYSDGVQGDNGGIMNVAKLGDMIGEAIKYLKDGKRYTFKYIEIMTASQQAFIEFVSKTFSIDSPEVVETAAIKLRTAYKNNICYPVWCLKTEENTELHACLDLISRIMYTDTDTNISAMASELGDMFVREKGLSEQVSAVITPQNAENSMRKFIEAFENGAIVEYGRKIGIHDVLPDVKKSIAAEAKSYLWDKQEGENQLRRLLMDYKIINASNHILVSDSGDPLNNIKSVYDKWGVFASTIKMPYGMMKKHCSELLIFLECLNTIKRERQLPDNRKDEFLAELTDKATLIAALNDKAKALYLSEFGQYTEGFSESDIEHLIAKMPQTSFTDDLSDYETRLKSNSNIMKQELDRTKLRNLWKQLTNSDSPKAWSENNLMPIKAVPTDDESEKADVLWKAFEGYNDPNIVKKALAFLESTPCFIEKLSDKGGLDMLFADKILEKYKTILVNTNAVKEYITKTCRVSAYVWDTNPSVRNAVKSLAGSEYRTGGNQGVMDRIDDMTPDEAKTYLKSLVKDDVEVGISIILKG